MGATLRAAAAATLLVAGCSGGGAAATTSLGPGPHDLSLDVDGVTRTALLVVPADVSGPVPLVVAFHGHGGSGHRFDRVMDVEGRWPEAAVVYPDGLTGHAGRTDPEGVRSGWQTAAGDEGDRDIAFYDELLDAVGDAIPIDPDRLYLVGHSNGARFASVLLAERGEAVAAGRDGDILAIAHPVGRDAAADRSADIEMAAVGRVEGELRAVKADLE
jgi:poly(3-hydroxybutyrate) depolymerase